MVQTLLGNIFNVFTEVFTNMRSWLGIIRAMFWSPNNGLTEFGILAIAALAISVFFLLMRVVENFLHFRA